MSEVVRYYGYSIPTKSFHEMMETADEAEAIQYLTSPEVTALGYFGFYTEKDAGELAKMFNRVEAEGTILFKHAFVGSLWGAAAPVRDQDAVLKFAAIDGQLSVHIPAYQYKSVMIYRKAFVTKHGIGIRKT